MNWLNQAACLHEDPELFFPIGTHGPSIVQTREAKQVCRRCLVRGECLDWALNGGPDHGVWGGLDPEERRRLKRVASTSAEDPPGAGFCGEVSPVTVRPSARSRQ